MTRSIWGTPVRRAAPAILGDLAIALLVALTLARLVASGVLGSAGQLTLIPQWFHEELPPLLGLLVDGQPISRIDERQYGVVAFLVFDPVIRLVGRDLALLQLYALVVGIVAIAVSLLLLHRRFVGGGTRVLLLHAVVWGNFAPLIFALALRGVDTWQLFFVSASLVMFTSPAGGLRLFSAVPLAAGALTKLLPAFLLAFVLVRQPRAGAVGLAAAAVLLGVGQVLYGSLMGLGYPLAILDAAPDAAARWSTAHENNALRGLVHKLGAGFQLEGNSVRLNEWAPVLNIVSYALVAALAAYVLWLAIRGRGRDTVARRSLEFSLAIVTMLLISPAIGHEHVIVTLPAFATLYFLWRGGGLTGMLSWSAVGALLLIGVFLPMSVVSRLIPFDALVSITSNTSAPFLKNIGAYDFFGFVGAGLIVLWGVLAMAVRRTNDHLRVS